MLKLSKEGIAAGVDAGDQKLSFDVIVDENHPAASRITLSFDNAITLGDLNCTGSVTTDPSSGNGVCGDIQFDYGTGSFTFDNVSIVERNDKTGALDAITFDVNLGNPLVADSAFRVILGDLTDTTTLATVAGESFVTFSSVEADLTTPIDNGVGKIAEESTQFGFEVSKKFDGIIDRDDLTTFVDGSTDITTWTFVNDETLGAALTLTDADIVYSGNFATVVNGELAASTLKINTGVPVSAPASIVTKTTGSTTSTVGVKHDLGTTVGGYNGVKTTYTGNIDFTRVASSTDNIPVTTPTSVSVTINASNYTVKAADFQSLIFDNVAGGEWKIDATIINVPYYVVNSDDTQSNIHIANEANTAAPIYVTAIDEDGNVYPAADLADLAANTVTKIRPADLIEKLMIPDTTNKLSLTFNIDGFAQDISLYAFSQNSKGRSEVSNSQYKIDGKVVKSKSVQ